MPNIWKYTIQGFKEAINNEEMSMPETAERISDILTASTWNRALRAYNEFDSTLEDILEELRDAGEAEDIEWFDNVLGAIYDEADYHKVWLG